MTSALSLPIPGTVTNLIATVAEAVILPRFRQLGSGDIRQKTGPTDLVTIADEEAEALLTRRLTDLLPGSTVVGEEATAADETVLDRLSGTDPVWVIDPVDGTLNFAAGRPAFAVIVALVAGGETRMGWIHDPLNRRTAWAAAGQGAWMQEAGENRRLRVAAPVPLAAMTGAMSTRYCEPEAGRRLEERQAGLGPVVCLASAAHEYIRLAEGRSHYSLYHRLMPWDHAAGVLIHGEAGGYTALVDGTPYRPTVRSGGLLAAPDRDSWEALHRHLFG